MRTRPIARTSAFVLMLLLGVTSAGAIDRPDTFYPLGSGRGVKMADAMVEDELLVRGPVADLLFRDSDDAEKLTDCRLRTSCSDAATDTQDCDFSVSCLQAGSLVNVLTFTAGSLLTLGNSSITTQILGAAAVPSNSITTANIQTAAVTPDKIGGGLDKLIVCGQLVNAATVYLGPGVTGYLGGDSVDYTAGGTACDALESATEATADNPITADFPALQVTGMMCRLTADPASNVVFTLRSAAANVSPSLTCTVAGAGSAQSCVATAAGAGGTPTIAAGATLAVQVVTLEDLSLQDGWCQLYFGLE